MAEDEVCGRPRGLGRAWEVVGVVGWWGGGEGYGLKQLTQGRGNFFYYLAIHAHVITLPFPFNKDPSDELWGCSACDIVRFSQDFTALCWPDLFAS